MSAPTPATCQRLVWARQSRGILGQGRESFAMAPHPCGRPVVDGHEVCGRHLAEQAKIDAELERRRTPSRTDGRCAFCQPWQRFCTHRSSS